MCTDVSLPMQPQTAAVCPPIILFIASNQRIKLVNVYEYGMHFASYRLLIVVLHRTSDIRIAWVDGMVDISTTYLFPPKPLPPKIGAHRHFPAKSSMMHVPRHLSSSFHRAVVVSSSSAASAAATIFTSPS